MCEMSCDHTHYMHIQLSAEYFILKSFLEKHIPSLVLANVIDHISCGSKEAFNLAWCFAVMGRVVAGHRTRWNPQGPEEGNGYSSKHPALAKPAVRSPLLIF